MNFDPSKVIDTRTVSSVSDGIYYMSDSESGLKKYHEADIHPLYIKNNIDSEGDIFTTLNFLYPKDNTNTNTNTNTHRTKHRRVLAPLYLRMK